MEHYFFENPWPGFTVLIIFWAIMRLIGRRAPGDVGMRIRRASWGVLIVAAVLQIVAFYAITPGEHLRESLTQLLGSMREGDIPAFNEVADEQLRVEWAPLSWQGQEVRDELANWDIQSVILIDTPTLVIAGTEAGTQIHVRATIEGHGMTAPHLGIWDIDWHLENGRWVAYQITYLRQGGLLPENPDP